MKKLSLLLIALCIVLCSCSKSSETPVSETKATNMPTQDENVEKSQSVNIACAVCNKITDCTEYTTKKYYVELNDYLEKTYYLCDSCYPLVVQNECDKETYDCLIAYTQIALTDKKIVPDEANGKIIIDRTGISFEGFGDSFIESLKTVADSEFSTMVTSKEYSITVKDMFIKRERDPKSILEVTSEE